MDSAHTNRSIRRIKKTAGAGEMKATGREEHRKRASTTNARSS
jgi:hypothetical protein